MVAGCNMSLPEWFHRKKKEEEAVIDKEVLSKTTISKILRTVPYQKAFHFYEAIGKPTGKYAASLSDFCNKIKNVSIKSLTFHLKRGDFEKWIGETIGDLELAEKIGKIEVRGKAIRNELHRYVSNRIKELKNMWPISLITPEPATVKTEI